MGPTTVACSEKTTTPSSPPPRERSIYTPSSSPGFLAFRSFTSSSKYDAVFIHSKLFQARQQVVASVQQSQGAALKVRKSINVCYLRTLTVRALAPRISLKQIICCTPLPCISLPGRCKKKVGEDQVMTAACGLEIQSHQVGPHVHYALLEINWVML